MQLVEGIAALSEEMTHDVCVVGSGPVGLCLALDLCARGLTVVLLESGLRKPDKAREALSWAHIVSDRVHAQMPLAVCRALGGTSWLWGGRCLPLDAIDFQKRDYSPDSMWPISESDLTPYYARTAQMLGCGPADFSEENTDLGLHENTQIRMDRFERWTNEPNTARRLLTGALPKSLTIVLDATVVGLDFDTANQRVIGATVASRAILKQFRGAKTYVVACGGVETTRLLLNVQTRFPRLFGGAEGTLGRYYMGHLSGRIANIQFSNPALAKLFDYRGDIDSVKRRLLTLSGAIQIKAGIPNISFYPENPRMADPQHGSGMLSAAFLLLSIPILGRLFVAEAIRRAQVGKEARYLEHIRNIILDLPATASAFYSVACQRILRKRRKPFFFLPTRDGRYPLHFHAEHLSNRDSCVSLINEVDALGMRRISVDLRFSRRDAEGISRAHEILDKGLRAIQIGKLEFDQTIAERPMTILGQATDGFHQIGLTRMGYKSQDGVVDANCRVFGVKNLFLAGSSVFRTSGQANPTFSATALALRLSAHLFGLIKKSTLVIAS
jgi:GMC oxidoreductase/FAD binding domain